MLNTDDSSVLWPVNYKLPIHLLIHLSVADSDGDSEFDQDNIFGTL